MSAEGGYAPVRREKLSETVAERLRTEIRSGRMKPGERIPNHRELAEAFSVGLSSIREAISALANEGLIEARAGRGTFVREVRGGALRLSADGRTLTQSEVEQGIEAREVLELQLAAMAAERASEEDIGRLRECVAAMERAVGDAAAYAEADLQLHLAIAAAARNRFLQQAMEQIRSLMRQNMQLSFSTALERHGSLQFSLESHRELVDRIEAGDADAARATVFEIMSRHHRFVLETS
jgi:DNA-binding FadR family transcriptional regulator